MNRQRYLDPPSGSVEGALLLAATLILWLGAAAIYDAWVALLAVVVWVVGGRIGRLVALGRWWTEDS